MTSRMLRSHPLETETVDPALEAALSALAECAQVCTICADACLAEDAVGCCGPAGGGG